MQAYLTLALQLAQAGAEIAPLAKALYSSWSNGGDPTEADWAELHRIRDEQTVDIQAPIPDEDQS